jgi:hypothetical protein
VFSSVKEHYADASGGSGRCSRPVFPDKNDPDYRAILAAFEPTRESLERTPRMDMPGAQPASGVNRECK